jgi:adenosylhomocysteine nucleosidase
VSIAAVADKARVFLETGAVAVDMESLGVAAVAAARDLPFIAARVIVDTAADALPRAVAAASRAGLLNVPGLIGGFVLAPQDLFAVIGLARRYRAATRSIAWMVRAGLLTPIIAGTRVA